jgi:hypothetical protein
VLANYSVGDFSAEPSLLDVRKDVIQAFNGFVDIARLALQFTLFASSAA